MQFTCGLFAYDVNPGNNNSKNIDITIWRLIELENKNNCQNSSDILLPTNDILNYDIVNQYLQKQERHTIRDINQRPNYHCVGNILNSNKTLCIALKSLLF